MLRALARHGTLVTLGLTGGPVRSGSCGFLRLRFGLLLSRRTRGFKSAGNAKFQRIRPIGARLRFENNCKLLSQTGL